MKNHYKNAACLGVLLFSTSLYAATTWTLNTGTVVGKDSVSGLSTGVNTTSTGWADTGSGTPRAIEQQLPAPNNSGNLRLYSGGLGINNLDGCSRGTTCDKGDLANSAPEHAIDNNQRYEMVMLSFGAGQKVNLTNVKFGWTGTSNYAGGDSDYTVLAYTGNTPFSGSLAGSTWGSLLSSGWQLIGNYENALQNENRSLNSAGVAVPNVSNVYSSFWLIGAFNPLNNNAQTGGYDYLKLSAVTGNVCTPNTPGCGNKTPEPGSLALLGLGLLGLVRMRKHR